MAQLVLAGDVGGTKTHLGLYEVVAGPGSLRLVREHRYPTQAHKSLEDVCALFIAKSEHVETACFGVPGPVIDGRAQATNVPWQMNEQALAAALSAPTRLINDLGATAYGMLHLGAGEFEVLQRGSFPLGHGNIAVIAAGTGLGEASLVFDDGRYHAVPSEGGHSDFAPLGDDQIELLKSLAHQWEHVSCERVLSGPGLHTIYRFMRTRAGEPEPGWLASALVAGDPSAAIADAALAGRDATCVRALEMFCEIYGAEASNLALKVLAFGGVFLGGGIAPKILPMLRRGGFLRAFLAKGRLAELLRRIEVRVSLNDSAALMGAAHLAAETLR
jgi:glucokinase